MVEHVLVAIHFDIHGCPAGIGPANIIGMVRVKPVRICKQGQVRVPEESVIVFKLREDNGIAFILYGKRNVTQYGITFRIN